MIKYRSLLEITKPYKVVAADVAEGKINHCYMLTGDDKVAIDGLITLMSEKILCDKKLEPLSFEEKNDLVATNSTERSVKSVSAPNKAIFVLFGLATLISLIFMFF